MPFVGQAEGKGVYGRYHSVFANLNFPLLSWGGCIAYPWEGAMRRPDSRDGREVRISHAFFVSIYFMFNWPRQGERVG